MRSIYLLFIVCLSFSCGNQNEIKNLLTNNGKGKYWDLIYNSNIDGEPQQVIDQRNQLPKKSIFLAKKGLLINYYNYDSMHVIELNKITGDILLDNNFELKGDLFRANGRDFHIKKLSSDSLILNAIGNEHIVQKYISSKNQNKNVLDSLPLKNY